MPATARPRRSRDYPDDIFADTRMSFGDHIEELRDVPHPRAARGGGRAARRPGPGRHRLLDRGEVDRLRPAAAGDDHRPGRGPGAGVLPAAEREGQGGAGPDQPADPDEVSGRARTASWTRNGQGHEPADRPPAGRPAGRPASGCRCGSRPRRWPTPSALPVQAGRPGVHRWPRLEVIPAHFSYLSNKGEGYIGLRQFMRTQNPQEAMVVYFKVAIMGSLWCWPPRGCSSRCGRSWRPGCTRTSGLTCTSFIGPSVGLFVGRGAGVPVRGAARGRQGAHQRSTTTSTWTRTCG